MDVAVEEQRIPAEDNAKNHSEKEDKNEEEEEDTNQSAQPKIDQGAEKRCNDKKSQEEPASEGGCAMIKKEQILLSKAEKTQVPTDVEELNDAAQTHLLVDKYWKESYLANCIPVILDPRYKLEFIVFRIKQAFEDNAAEHLQKVDIVIKSLFKEYSHEMGDSLSDPLEEEFHIDEVEEDDNPLADWEDHLRVQKKQAASELDRYLSEELFPRKKDFDILGWWEMNSPKYPVLSRIARDVLAIQASTVASESSFSAGGRIISDHRTRLKSDTVEGLICLQDWLKAADPKSSNKDVEKEEYLVFHQASKQVPGRKPGSLAHKKIEFTRPRPCVE